MFKVRTALALTVGLLASACSPSSAGEQENSALTLRNLTETPVAAPLRKTYQIEGDLIPTPSDQRTRYFLLRQRAPLSSGNLVALLREEQGDRAAYARVELNCQERTFHIVGIANRRSFAETSTANDGPLRSLDGYPLREEIASFVCAEHGTPLRSAS